MSKRSVTVSAPINMALIKYWGKRNEHLMLPLNDSISVTIDALRARTTVTLLESVDQQDTVIVNGVQLCLKEHQRFARCFEQVRRLARENGTANVGMIMVESMTNFPVQAGLASSAAGFAALAYAIGQLFDLDQNTVVRMARLGTNVVLDGNFLCGVPEARVEEFSRVSYIGRQGFPLTIRISLTPSHHWPDLRVVIAVTCCARKSLGSTKAMRISTETSLLLRERVRTVVPQRVELILKAIETKDFRTFAEIVMKDSNQLHAVCLDSFPPINYLNESSWHVINCIESLNKSIDSSICAYTFDAGPNCCIFTTVDNLPLLLAHLNRFCPTGEQNQLFSRLDNDTIHSAKMVQLLENVTDLQPMTDAVQYLVVSTVGKGPVTIEDLPIC